jgi:CheY-like chemotaxis protein
VASRGASAVALARDLEPDAVTLDIRLPDIDGWRVLRTLKGDPATRHIPVVIVSTDDEVEAGRSRGALGVLAKPISRREDLDAMLESIGAYVGRSERRVLWIAASGAPATSAALLASEPGVQITLATDLAEIELALETSEFDAVVVEASDDALRERLLPSVMRTARLADRRIPVLCVEGASSESGDEGLRVWPGSEWVREDEVAGALAGHLHLRADGMTQALRAAVQAASVRRNALAARKVLIVDDDIRNIFAMTTVLEKHAMNVVSAETGQAAIELLGADPSIDLVLMDVMMPGMDGFETMREIRRRPEYRSLPIVAVTAKAMKGDREKTLQAGAWDYLAKPVDVDRMMTVLQVWLQS